MAELKTKKTVASVDEFLAKIPDEDRRSDCRAVAKMMERATGEKPRMWSSSIVGFGDYHYVYETGREGDWFITGFSPRKNDLTLYINAGFTENDPLLARLGKHKTGKSCLYIRKLSDVDTKVLEQLIGRSVQELRKRWRS